MLAIHLAGTFHNMQAVAPLMIAGGGGSIVNISSDAAVMGVPGNPHYAAAKAGVLGLRVPQLPSSDRVASASTRSFPA